MCYTAKERENIDYGGLFQEYGQSNRILNNFDAPENRKLQAITYSGETAKNFVRLAIFLE